MPKDFKTLSILLCTFCALLILCGFNRHRSHQMKLPEICKAGKVYTITKIQDLSDSVEDLECIYRVGEEPTSIPLGALVGFNLIIANTLFFNPLADASWIGKYTMNVTCTGKTAFLGWNGFLGDLAFPYAMFLGKIHNFSNIHPIWKDNKTSIILDYSRPVSEYCANYDEILENKSYQLKIKRSANYQMVAPFSFVIDGIRPVGRQKDGGLIYLGQTYIRDKYRSDALTVLAAYFAVISYDENAEKHLKVGHSLTPLNKDVRYFHMTSWDILTVPLPFDNFFTEPMHSMKQFIYEFLTGIRNAVNYCMKCLAGLWGDDRRTFKKEMEKSISKYQAFLNSEMNLTKKNSILLSHPDVVHSHYNEL